MKFKDKLRTLRLNKGLTQRELAELTDISVPAIEKYENGQREPKQSYLKRLAKALDVDVNELTLCLSQYQLYKNLNTIESIYDLFDNDAIFNNTVQGISKMAIFLKDKYDSTTGKENELVVERIRSLSFLLDTINEYLKLPNEHDAVYIQSALNKLFDVDGIKISKDKNE